MVVCSEVGSISGVGFRRCLGLELLGMSVGTGDEPFGVCKPTVDGVAVVTE